MLRSYELPRNPNASDEEILDITNQLIAKHDVSGVTVDMVASKAGVSKATIYRRWPSRSALILDALTIMHRPSGKPDTGSIRSDLYILLKELVEFLNRRNGSKLFLSFLNEAMRNPKLAQANRKISSEVRASYVAAIDQAIKRGELDGSVNVELMIDLLISPFLYRRFTGTSTVDAADIEPIIDVALNAFGKE